jgi:uncharacterized protein YdeI (YjbR/CyaY-like superfamily)
MTAPNNNTNKLDLEIISFGSPAEWEHWLGHNHATSKGIWLRFYKKGSGISSVYYAEALDVALCYGWIDGQLKKYDELSYIQRFTPRRPRSLWSKRNIEHIARLTNEGRMKPAGLQQAEAAKVDGRWEVAYDSQGQMAIPDDFLNELTKNKKALAFYETLNKANQYAIAWRLQTAKRPETREKRKQEILEMLAREEKFHM